MPCDVSFLVVCLFNEKGLFIDKEFIATRACRPLPLAECYPNSARRPCGVDYLFAVSRAGCLWRITTRDAAPPPSLYTFRPAVDGSARDCPRATGAVGVPRILPVAGCDELNKLHSRFRKPPQNRRQRRHRFRWTGCIVSICRS